MCVGCGVVCEKRKGRGLIAVRCILTTSDLTFKWSETSRRVLRAMGCDWFYFLNTHFSVKPNGQISTANPAKKGKSPSTTCDPAKERRKQKAGAELSRWVTTVLRSGSLMGMAPNRIQSSRNGLPMSKWRTCSSGKCLYLVKSSIDFLVAVGLPFLLGAGESGKSTVIKQLKSIYNIKPEESELNTAAAAIHYNTLYMMRILIANQR